MQIIRERCPRCETDFIVDRGLWEVGTIRLRCVSCAHYFLPAGSPRSRTIESAANASVPLTIWEPPDADQDAVDA